jgi:hypothetical protein
MGKGKQFELDVKRDINETTRGWVKAHRPDFSGSSVGEAADVMVVWQAERYDDQRPSGHPERHVAYAELKKRSGEEGKRTTVMSGSSQDQSGLEELQELRHELPAWSRRRVGIKFPHRELITLNVDDLEHWLRRDEEGWGSRVEGLDAEMFHGARLTPSDNISMVMPTLESGWPSSSAGRPDHIKLLHAMGVEDYDMTQEARDY